MRREAKLFLLALNLLAGNTSALPPEAVTTPPAEDKTTARVVVRLAHAEGAPLSGEGFIVFKGASPSPVVIPAKLPGPIEARLPTGSQWTLIPDFPGYFAANSILQVPADIQSGPIELKVDLRPAGILTGKYLTDRKDPLPNRMEARFEPTRGLPPLKRPIPSGIATCAVNGEGEWRCRVPAGNLDVALYPQGFVPHYLWKIAIEPGKEHRLDPRKLVRGASVAGWVTKEDGTPAEKCKVRLEPASAPGRPNDPMVEFLRSVASEATCQKQGFFQFTAVAPGSYTVVAQEGEAQAQLSPVEVWNGSESRISSPLTLRLPVDFEVLISPPMDWLGRPWRFEARRALEYRSGWEDPSYRAEASPEGRVQIRKRPPGRFWITVYDGLGNSVFSDMHVDLTDPNLPYTIDLKIFRVEGTIELGDKPLQADLWFGGRSGTISIRMTADEEGRFEGPLPEDGIWRIDVEAAEPRIKASTQVEVRPKEGQAEVIVRLPDTRVYGRVVDAEGGPASDARVALGSTISTLETRVDPRGEFEFRAFPEGTIELFASGANGRNSQEESATYLFEATEEAEHGPVVLALRRNQKLRGRVLSPTGPVIGAVVDAWPAPSPGGTVSTVRTQLDGSFELTVPEGTRGLQAVLSPPGGALKAFTTFLSSGAELLFQVEPNGGELRIEPDSKDALEHMVVAVWQGDIGIPLGILYNWAEGHGVRFIEGGRVRIPQLAPGFYTVCLGLPAVADPSAVDEWKSRGECASGYLSAGSTLDLRLK